MAKEDFRNKSYWMTTRDYVPGDALQDELDVDVVGGG